MQSRKRCVALVLVMLTAVAAEGQWVMAARAVSGRVQRMTQKSSSGGYDVATVVLAAGAAGVYDNAIKALKANPQLTIAKQDAKKGNIQFRKGEMVAGLQITPLGDKLTQLVIASSAGDASSAGSSSLVVDGVLRVCREMKIECTVQPD